MVGDIAEPLSVAGPPPQGTGRDSDTVEGGAGPFGPTGGLRQREEGGTDSSHPVVELIAQQTLFIVARGEQVKIEVPDNKDGGGYCDESEEGSEDFGPGVRREIDDHDSEIDIKGADAAVDALDAAGDKDGRGEAKYAGRQEDGGTPLGSAVRAGPSRGGDDSGHREDATPAGRAARVPVSLDNSNKPLTPDGREDICSLIPGGVGEGVPQPSEIPIRVGWSAGQIVS